MNSNYISNLGDNNLGNFYFSEGITKTCRAQHFTQDFDSCTKGKHA